MSLSRTHTQETVTRLCQKFTSTFGASYCGLSLFAGLESHSAYDGKQAFSTLVSDGQAAAGMAIVPIMQYNHRPQVAASTAGHDEQGDESPAPLVHDENRLATIAEACQAAQPILRFDLHHPATESENGQSHLLGFLYLAFDQPKHFTDAELSALLAMAEIVTTILAFLKSEAQGTDTLSSLSVGSQAVPGEQLLEYPFLEAKKHWIKAFEREYLGQQLAKYSGNISMVARAARISRYTVYALLNKFQLSAKSFKRKKSNGAPRGLGEMKETPHVLESSVTTNEDELA